MWCIQLQVSRNMSTGRCFLLFVFSNVNNAPPQWSYSTIHSTTFSFIAWWDTHFSVWLIFWLDNRNIAVAAFSISSSEAYSGSCRNLPFIFPKKITPMYWHCFVHFLAFFRCSDVVYSPTHNKNRTQWKWDPQSHFRVRTCFFRYAKLIAAWTRSEWTKFLFAVAGS